nr:hypothetical protein GCM10025732_43250 [Glycomyces mayteni]
MDAAAYSSALDPSWLRTVTAAPGSPHVAATEAPVSSTTATAAAVNANRADASVPSV